MSKEKLQNIITDFDPEKFIHFFREKNREFTPRTEELTIYNDDNFSNCFRLGKIDFPEGANMVICSLNTDKSLTERSGKKSQYEKGKKILKETQSDSGIFIFYDNTGNFRFSLIYANYLGNKRDWSTFKRFTYFVSKEFTNKTFLIRIGDGDFSDLEKIKEAFSVEKVNKEFYREIAIKFSELVGGERKVKSKIEKFKPLLKLPGTDNHQKLQEFAVRMIGRIVFCWFLKKKKSQNGVSLIPENILSKDAAEKNKNYYHAVLEKLFFEVLNTKQEERKEFRGYKIYKDIPFLNGGLFEPHDDDLYKPSLLNSLIIPDEWLTEFLGILESYNFTIDENTSIDVELSIDPEMLGRIFENLLAEINPETGETARKSTGSYYTPRPIVEYMVDESLKQYLITKTDIPESKLAMLLSYSSEEAEISDKESVKIINALDEIKILDPACGSGAFPIGILQKMLLILQKIDKNSTKWLEKKLDKIESSVLRNELKTKFKNENLDYIRKLGLIQDSIYGVDIQSIAVEISKLRCFLTLVVDEDVDDKKPNRGIIPLPNLEFKFVAANTLISLPEEEGSLFDEGEYITQLEGLRDDYFTSYGQKKLQIESDFISIQEKMVKQLIRNRITEGRAFELASWNPFFNEEAEWFDPKWMFGMKDGFDIVIGNPPYLSISKLESIKKSNLEKQKFKTFDKSGDIYLIFLECGSNLLKENGVLSFITSRQWMHSEYGKKTRQFLLYHTNPLKLIDFGRIKIFDSATVFVNVLIFQKAHFNNDLLAAEIYPDFNLISDSLSSYFDKNKIQIRKLSEDTWKISSDSQFIINEKIEKIGKPLEEIDVEFYSGIKTAFNPAFHINSEIKNILISKDSKSEEILKPMLRGKDIKRYQYVFKNLFLINSHNGVKELKIGRINVVKDYPSIYDYFKKFKKELEPRQDQGEHWTNLRNCAYLMEFEKEKIVWLEISDKANYAYDNKGMYLTNSAYFLTGKNLKYILAILNSKISDYYFFQITAKIAGGRKRYTKQYVGRIRIPELNEKLQQPFINLVDQILRLKSQNKDTTELENQIDVMVYKLYELTYDEVKIVDPEFWMSEGEYGEFEIKD